MKQPCSKRAGESSLMLSKNKKSFGKGLSDILRMAEVNLADASQDFRTFEQAFKQLTIDQLIPGRYQPRREFEPQALAELANSIRNHGILQPILVRESEDKYEIIAGERRWRAAQMAGLQQVPVLVGKIDNESALAFGLIENLQRSDLNPIEEAEALQRLIDEFGMTHESVALAVGRSRAMVSNLLRLLNLIPSVKALLIQRQIEMGHARALLTLSENEQQHAADKVVQQGLSVRQAEKLVQTLKAGTPKKKLMHSSGRAIECQAWEQRLSRSLGSRVTVAVDQQGLGKLTIQIDSIAKLTQIISVLENME